MRNYCIVYVNGERLSAVALQAETPIAEVFTLFRNMYNLPAVAVLSDSVMGCYLFAKEFNEKNITVNEVQSLGMLQNSLLLAPNQMGLFPIFYGQEMGENYSTRLCISLQANQAYAGYVVAPRYVDFLNRAFK